MDKEVIRKIDVDWKNALPSLKEYARFKYYKIIGPLITGIELHKVPYLEKYRPYFVMYSLWGKSLKECWEEPPIYLEVSNSKNLQFFVPYMQHSKYFDECLASTLRESYISFSGDIRLSEILNGVDKYQRVPIVEAQGSPARARLLQFVIMCALYVNDAPTISRLVAEAVENKNIWDLSLFKHWFGGYDKWFESIRIQLDNRDEFMRQIEANKTDKKLARLNFSELIA